jgi:hypothetical protein
MSDRKRVLDVSGGSFLRWILTYLGSWFVVRVPFRLDDPYILLHSADVLLSGGPDPIFGSPALTGVTSLPYFVLVLLVRSLGLGPIVTLRAVAALGLTAFVLGTWALARRASLSTPWALSVVALAVASGSQLAGLTNGLETGLAAALLIWMLRWCGTRNWLAVAVGAGLLPWLRPDLAIVAAAVWLHAMWGRTRREQAVAAGISIAAGLPWPLWLYADTGAWLSQTMEAKRLFFAEGCAPLGEKLRLAGQGVLAWLTWTAPLTVGLAALAWSGFGRVGLAAATVTLAVYAYRLPSAVTYNEHRYLVPILAPWCVWGLVEGISRLRRAKLSALAAAGACLGLLHAAPYALTALTSSWPRDIIATAVWIDEYTPPDATLLIHDAGGVSVFAHRRAVDLVGLKTPSSIGAHATWTWPSCGRARATAVAAIASGARPTYLVTAEQWEQVYQLTGALATAGLRATPVRTPPAGSEYGYTVWALAVPPDGSKGR